MHQKYRISHVCCQSILLYSPSGEAVHHGRDAIILPRPDRVLREGADLAIELLVDPSKTLYIKENSVFEGLRNLNIYGMEVPTGVEPVYKALQASA